MTPTTRTGLSLIPLALQFVAMVSALGAISFFVPATAAFLKTYEGKIVVPAPTRLLVEHSGAAKLVVVGLFAVSVITFLITRFKLKEEADRLAVQSAVCSAVWLIAVTYVGGVLMAAALPHFALGSR
jgi:type II secretory pathway component PulF